MRTRLAGLLVASFLLTPPVWAEEQFTPDPAGEGLSSFDLGSAFRTLKELLSLAEPYVRDHLDLDARYHPGGPAGNTWGTLRFKFYPEGRSNSEEAVDAETWFSFDQGRFSFHFRFREPTPVSPEALASLL